MTILKDEQSYTGATVIRSGGLTLQDKGALYVGVSLTNASVELNNATLLFDNASLSTTAAGPTRIPSTVPILLKAGTIAVKPGASADTTTALGTVTVGAYYNNILSNQTVNQGGVALSSTLGGTNTLTINNLTTSNTGGVVSFGKYSNQNGALVDSQAQRVFVTQVNGLTVTAGSGWHVAGVGDDRRKCGRTGQCNGLDRICHAEFHRIWDRGLWRYELWCASLSGRHYCRG